MADFRVDVDFSDGAFARSRRRGEESHAPSSGRHRVVAIAVAVISTYLLICLFVPGLAPAWTKKASEMAPARPPTPRQFIVAPSASNQPDSRFCETFQVPSISVPEIAQDGTSDSQPASLYVSVGEAGQYFESWPTVLSANPSCSRCRGGPYRKNVGGSRVVASGQCFWRSPNIFEPYCYYMGLCKDIMIFYPPPPHTPPVPNSLNNMRWLLAATQLCAVSYPSVNTTLVVISELPAAGHVFSWVVHKCMTYLWAPGEPLVMLTDEWNNTYAMHATNEETATSATVNISAIKPPPGWSVTRHVVGAQPLELWPYRWYLPEINGGLSDICLNVILRDNMGNGYHQMTWGSQVHSTEPGYLSVVAQQPRCLNSLIDAGFLVKES